MTDQMKGPYSVFEGYAAEDLGDSTTIIKFVSEDILPSSINGDIAAGVTDSVINLKDHAGNPITKKISTSNHLPATWMGGSNRHSPPLIRKGEPLEIIQYHGQDKYFWRETGMGGTYRTTDRIYLELSSTDPKKPGVVSDDTNRWILYADTDKKKFGIRTSIANGEVGKFHIEGDLTAGTFTLTDGEGDDSNNVVFDTGADSGVPIFSVSLGEKASFQMTNQDLMINIPRKFIVKSGERVLFDSPLTVFNESRKGSIIFNALNMALNATSSLVITSSVFSAIVSATKLMGTTVLDKLRVSKFGKGPVGSAPSPVSVGDPYSADASSPSASPDSDLGTPVTSLPVA